MQKLDLFYGLDFITFGYQLMLTLFVQLMGMGFAGYLRRFRYLHYRQFLKSNG